VQTQNFGFAVLGDEPRRPDLQDLRKTPSPKLGLVHQFGGDPTKVLGQ
jgi:hypothetical protein